MQLYWYAAQFKTCTGSRSWEILRKPSKHLWLEHIFLKKLFSCSVKCVQTIISPQNMSHPSWCYQHCQESNSSLEYLSISFWWDFGGLLPSSIFEQVPFLVINVPNNLSQLQDGLITIWAVIRKLKENSNLWTKHWLTWELGEPQEGILSWFCIPLFLLLPFYRTRVPNGLKIPNVVFAGSVTIIHPAQQELNRVQREIRNDYRWPVLTVGSKAIILKLKTQHWAGLWTWERRSSVVCLERDHSLGSTASFQRNPKIVISGLMLVCWSSYFWGNLKGKDQRNWGCSVNRGILEICLHLCCYNPLQAIHFNATSS